MVETAGAAHIERLDHLMHCANNCRQMLQAIDRKLARALICLEEGDVARGQELVKSVSGALPQAIAIIEHDNEAKAALSG